MPRNWRDAYDKLMTGKALPTTPKEEQYFRLAMAEEKRELLAQAIVEEQLLQQSKLSQRTGGRPRKAAADDELVRKLLNDHQGSVKRAREMFIRRMNEL